jgi:hypothetical protein
MTYYLYLAQQTVPLQWHLLTVTLPYIKQSVCWPVRLQIEFPPTFIALYSNTKFEWQLLRDLRYERLSYIDDYPSVSSFCISISPETISWISVIRDINDQCLRNGTLSLGVRVDLKLQNIKIYCRLFWTDLKTLESRQYRGSLLRDLGVTSLIIMVVGIRGGGGRGEISALLLALTSCLRYSCHEIL